MFNSNKQGLNNKKILYVVLFLSTVNSSVSSYASSYQEENEKVYKVNLKKNL